MKIIRAKKFSTKKPGGKTSKKPPTYLRRSDWGALMQHDRLTGKLNMKSKEVVRDPGSVKRLLEAAMIYPDGKLTPAARKKCAALAEKLQSRGAPVSAEPKAPGDDKPVAPPGKKPVQISAAHWAVLMKYDRKTGNLLRIDPKSGRLDKSSRLLLRNPAIIQHLIDKNLILPGGWLTPEAKQGCVRIEKKIKTQAQDRFSGPGDHCRRKSKNQAKAKIHSGPESRTDRNRRNFFKSLPNEVVVAASESGSHAAYDWQNEEDLQAFFESLPDAGPEPDPELYFVYDWKDERDLQAYFEKLPQDFSDPGITLRPGRESAPRADRGADERPRRLEAGKRKRGTQIFTDAHRLKAHSITKARKSGNTKNKRVKKSSRFK